MSNVLIMTESGISPRSSSESESSSGQSDTVTSSFELFWKAYPRKVGKLKARVAYQQITGRGKAVVIDGERIVLQASHEEIMEGLGRYIAANSNRVKGWLLEMEYTPHASTWLNQGRWEDGI